MATSSVFPIKCALESLLKETLPAEFKDLNYRELSQNEKNKNQIINEISRRILPKFNDVLISKNLAKGKEFPAQLYTIEVYNGVEKAVNKALAKYEKNLKSG